MFLCRVLCPLNVLSMADDIAMNQFQVVTDVAYVYGEKSDSSQGKIKKSDFFNLIPAYTKMYSASEEVDCNSLPYNSKVVCYKLVNGPVPNGYSFIVTTGYSPSWMAQIMSTIGGNGGIRIFVRSFYNGSTWSEWKSVTLT